MLGAIAGDMVGAPYEHSFDKPTDFELFTEASAFTDDTVLTCAVADKLVHHGQDEQALAAALRDHYRRYPHVPYGAWFHQWAQDPSMGPYHSFGNGSAMRVSPVAWAFDERDAVIAAARWSAAVTHDHPEGIKGAEAVALAVFLARQGAEPASIRGEVEAHTDYSLDHDLDELHRTYGFDATCQGSVPQALACALQAEDFEDALRKAIYIGGDSDTIACMAGAVAEARFGVPDWIAAEVMDRLDGHLTGVVDAFRARYRG